MEQLGGLLALTVTLRSRHASLRSMAYEALGLCCRDKPKNQLHALKLGVLDKSMQAFSGDEDATTRAKALQCLSGTSSVCPFAPALKKQSTDSGQWHGFVVTDRRRPVRFTSRAACVWTARGLGVHRGGTVERHRQDEAQSRVFCHWQHRLQGRCSRGSFCRCHSRPRHVCCT